MTSAGAPRPERSLPAAGSRLVYRGLVATAGVRSRSATAAWDRAWGLASKHLSGPVTTTIHGRSVVVNAGYSYPAFSKRWPTYNDPLVELVHQTHCARKRPITMVDVGAAVGDTALLVLDRCPGAVEAVHCVEGDPEFFRYLEGNVAAIPEVHPHFALVSDRDGEEAALVRVHSGTASSQGTGRSAAATLDGVLTGARCGPVDVLKIDTDGFDGKVLASARRRLHDDRPAVIFEWAPRVYDATGQSRSRPFEVLTEAGYTWFVWFTKYGTFSHVDQGYQPAPVRVLGDVCLSGSAPGPDWHYDVVALPEALAIDPGRLASLRFARDSRS